MRQVRIALLMMLIMTILLGLIYPLMMTGIAQLVFSYKANGSLARVGGQTVGSELLAQSFTGPGYFHGRPSANNYDGANSGGSNLGPTNRKLIDAAVMRAEQVRSENGHAQGTKVPADLVLASGSGLDPHISEAAALFQASRVAGARGMNKEIIVRLIERHREKIYVDLFGDTYVNVLGINRELDAMDGKK
jgi:potassium-transporting ATPase KdpC subunit